MGEPEPIFVDVERIVGMADPVRIEAGSLLVFNFDPDAGPTRRDFLRQVQDILGKVSDAGVGGVTAVVLSKNVSVKVLSEGTMREFGWVRPPDWSP